MDSAGRSPLERGLSNRCGLGRCEALAAYRFESCNPIAAGDPVIEQSCVNSTLARLGAQKAMAATSSLQWRYDVAVELTIL